MTLEGESSDISKMCIRFSGATLSTIKRSPGLVSHPWKDRYGGQMPGLTFILSAFTSH